MHVEHYVVLFDIDETLINFNQSSRKIITWIGSVDLWREYLEALQSCFNTASKQIHIGIATAKMRAGFVHNNIQFRGDLLSGAVLEDECYLQFHAQVKGLGVNKGLKRFIDPDLIFFTDGQNKIENAMMLARQIIQTKFPAPGHRIKHKNIIIIDDMELTCRTALHCGFRAIHVENLGSLNKAECEAAIGAIFLKIFEIFDLPIPVNMLQAVGALESDADEETSIANVEDELMNFMSGKEQATIGNLTDLARDRHIALEHEIAAMMIYSRMQTYYMSVTAARSRFFKSPAIKSSNCRVNDQSKHEIDNEINYNGRYSL